MDALTVTIWWILGLVIFAGIIMLAFFLVFRFKHHVIIRETVKGRKLIIFDKARDYKSEGVPYWQLRKEKDEERKLMPLPPSEAIEITKRGKKFVEAYRTETGEYAYIKDVGEVDRDFPEDFFDNVKIPEEIESIKDQKEKAQALEAWKERVITAWKKENHVIEAYQPLTTKQRLILVSNLKKANLRKGTTWRENIPMIVGLGAAVILVIALMVFWGDIAKPALDGRAMGLQEQKLQKETLEIIRDIKQGVQSIDAKQQELNNKIDNREEMPPD